MKLSIWIALFFLGFPWILPIAPAVSNVQPVQRVLILNSYHEGMLFSDDEMRGIRSVLPENVDVVVEFMDTKRVSSPTYFEILRNTYAYKYRDARFKVVLSLDDDAFQFLLKYGRSLFPGTPIVFCGVNQFSPEMIINHPEFAGVVETIDIKESIEIGYKLFPAAQKVLAITDNTSTGKINRAYLEKLANDGEIKLPIEFMDPGTGLTLVDLIERVKNAPKNSIIYYADFFQERDGEPLNPDTVMPRVSAAATAPIFAHGGLYLGLGAVGGKLNTGYYHGQNAGKMAARIIAGEPVSSIPILMRDQTRYMFDYRQLQRWGIKETELPPDSILINREPTLFDRYKSWIFGISVFVMFQTIVIGYLLINITRRRKAEFALRENERKYKETTDLLPQIVFESDLTGRLTFANQIAFSKFGYSKEEFQQGIYLTQTIIESDRQRALQNINMVMSGEPSGNSYTALCKDGSTFPVLIYSTPIHVEGKLTGFRGVIIDMTEQKKAEETILQMNANLEQRVSARTIELEAVNKELEAFSYSVSHDLRAPLRGMDGYSQALLEDYASHLDEQGKFYLQRIRTASQHMAELIDDLLMLSRMMRSEMHRQEVNLSLVAVLISEELRAASPERNIEWNIAPELRVCADPHLTRIVLYNLLENAWKFTAKSPNARIELGSRVIHDSQVFYVRDNGVGFDSNYVDKLFRAFQRLHSDREYPGTGIGLATVQRIIHRHGGKVWAESEPGNGATFYFTFST